jgi:dipeptidyl-peptidase-4
MAALRKSVPILLLLAPFPAPMLRAQVAKKELTISVISNRSAFSRYTPRRFAWRPHSDEVSYVLEQGPGGNVTSAIWLYSAQTQQRRMLLAQTPQGPRLSLSTYQWSPSGSSLLVEGERGLWIWDAQTHALKRLTPFQGPFEDISFSPDGRRVAFVSKNNIYLVDVKNGNSRKLTSDGSASLLDGKLDWVYGEELSYRATTRAYEWSPDGTRIAYLQLNDGPVFEYPITDFLKDHVTVSDQRFPQPGGPNPVASVHVISAGGGELQSFGLAAGEEYVSPDFEWTPDSKEVCFLTLNRDQTRETVHLWNPTAGSDEHPVVETDPYWINSLLPPFFFDQGQRFLWLSERDGWIHLYSYRRDGTLLEKLTTGEWMIDLPILQSATVQMDKPGGWVYFQATKPDPRQRQIYRIRFDGTGFSRITHEPGTHTFFLSPDGRFLIDNFSSVTTPPESLLLKADGTYVATISKPGNPLPGYVLGQTEFTSLKTDGGTPLYARLVKPPGFTPNKKYPVIVDVYGGPSIQMVRNRWGVTSPLDQMFSEHGFLIWQLDNRGSWGRGHAFETVIFKHMGKYELQDQLTGVNYLKSLSYVDPSRIGIWGWSYGGYMTLYSTTRAPEVFKCAVAGAPVTDWHYYDTIYTERYMRTPTENPEGYDQSSNVKAAGQLRAKLLLIHGTADDNVHLQNTIEFIQALINARIPYQLYLQPGQRHGFVTPVSVFYTNMRVFGFFEHNLK